MRKAFIMSVKAGFELEYERRHNPIWPEMEAALRDHGVLSYTIFLDSKTQQLFAFVEIENEARWQSIAQTSVCKRWWSYMKDIMPANADGSPVATELREVFHLEKSRL